MCKEAKDIAAQSLETLGIAAGMPMPHDTGAIEMYMVARTEALVSIALSLAALAEAGTFTLAEVSRAVNL